VDTSLIAGGKESTTVRGQRERKEISKLKMDLLSTRGSLQSIIEEQETTNEELKSANEEIQSSNEELQSTNEELETAKEELQSTNEELTTMNEELQVRNTELSQANNDLTNLLASVNIAILMLDNELRIRRFTPMAERIFNLIPSDLGRRLSDMNRTILVPDLDQSVREVVDNLVSVERQTQDRNGNWYFLRIRPYRTRENKIEGAVILLVDNNELRRALDAVLRTVPAPIAILGNDLKVKTANESFKTAMGLTNGNIDPKPIFELGSGQFNTPAFRELLEDVAAKNKTIEDHELEANFGEFGWRKARVHARRMSEEGKGLQLIALALEGFGKKTDS
jgi:two-component system CheB/CheR fusion protein